MGFIYIIKNTINDKVYIGQTTQSINKRMDQHRYASRFRVTKFHKAMRDIGIHKFSMEILEECNNRELNIKEVEYIKKYDSYNNGYNSTPGGGAKTSTLDELYGDTIVEMYTSGLSSVYIANIIDCSDVSILNILNCHGIERRKHNIKVVIIEEDKIFPSAVEVARYIIDSDRAKVKDIWGLSQRIKKHCIDGMSAYGYHYCFLEEYLDGSYKNKIKYSEIDYKPKSCKICNKPITKQSTTGLCISCSNVQAKGKSPKPSKEELESLLKQGLQKKQIAELYNRTDSTIHYWINSYGLSEYKNDKLLNQKKHDFTGITCVELNLHFNTFKEAAEYLIQNELTLATNINSLAYRISKAKQSKSKLSNLTWI